jgi:hypothetical protein
MRMVMSSLTMQFTRPPALPLARGPDLPVPERFKLHPEFVDRAEEFESTHLGALLAQ